jgi:uncharacterized protein
MIIRIVAKNIYSFKEKTEFNLFPNRSIHLSHHKINRNDISFLRLGAIYGANGVGKSNLIKTVGLLVHMVAGGKVLQGADDLKFKLCETNKSIPSSIAIEFYAQGKIYYYTISFDGTGVLYERLAESCKKKKINIFERSFEDGHELINFREGYTDDPENKLFVDILSDDLIKRNALLLYFLHKNYAADFADTSVAYKWFTETLVVMKAGDNDRPMAYLLDKKPVLLEFANKFIKSVDIGITALTVKKNEIDANDAKYSDLVAQLKEDPKAAAIFENKITDDVVTFVNEDGKIMAKRIISSHKNDKGEDVIFSFGSESDGIKRLVGFFPAIDGVVNDDHVYLIDEIERSIHPMIIKELISKLSADKKMKGQFIFTTNESSLLDQDILRTDEIWLTQKDSDGGTHLYSLSENNLHHKANIKNGYLNGRYGRIPFLSNLRDLHWDNEKPDKV